MPPELREAFVGTFYDTKHFTDAAGLEGKGLGADHTASKAEGDAVRPRGALSRACMSPPSAATSHCCDRGEGSWSRRVTWSGTVGRQPFPGRCFSRANALQVTFPSGSVLLSAFSLP